MLVNLLKIRLKALFYMMFGRRYSSKKPASKAKMILIGLLAFYIVAMLLFSMGTMMYPMAGPLSEAGLGWLYFSIAGVMAALFSIIGSIFTIQKELFDANDNELLLSMPVPYSYILASRLIIIVVLEFMYLAIVMIPAVVVYAIFGAGLTVQGTISLILASALLLLLVLAVGTLVSWLASLIISRIRAKTLVTTLLMFGIIGLYIWFYSYINRLLTKGDSIAEALRKGLPPAYSFGMAVAADGLQGLAHLGIFALWSLVPFAITYFVLTRNFLRLATSNKNVSTTVYRKRELKVSSGFGALVRKELNRFFTLPIYIFNCALGDIFMLIAAGYTIFRLDEILGIFKMIPGGDSLIAPVACLVLGFCALLNNTAAPSLSLEGKALWILKAHPIRPGDIFRAKIACNIIICLPFVVVSGIAMAIVLPVSVLGKVLIVVLPTVITFFTAVFGITANILFPRFEWINETMVVKQSASVMVAVLGGLAIAAAFVFLYIPTHNALPSDLFLIFCTAAFAGVTAALYRWVMTKGVKRLENMG